MNGQLNWFKGGLLLGTAFLIAVAFVKPIGVSTQFVIADGIVWNLFSDTVVQKDPKSKSGYSSPNAYLNKSGGKYAENIANPANYSFIFVLAMVAGAFLSSRLGGPQPTTLDRSAPEIWRQRFGENPTLRYVTVFFAGVLVLFGARLAGGVYQRSYDERHDADLFERLPVCHWYLCHWCSCGHFCLQQKLGGAL